MESRRPTLKQVAAKAGCSLGAVSVILNQAEGNIRVSPPTAARIRAAAKSLGYVPSYHARSLHLKRADTLGLVLGDVAHRLLSAGYWAKFVSSVDQATRARGYDLLFIGPSGNQNEVERAALALRQGRVDGLICTDNQYLAGDQRLLNELRHPVVFMRDRTRTPHPSILLDEGPAIAGVIAALRQLGHRGVTYVTAERRHRKPWAERLSLVKAGAAAADFRLDILYIDERVNTRHHPSADDIVGATYAGLTPLLKEARGLPTALLFYNDAFGLGGLQAVKDAGRRVPEDLSLIAFDNLRGGLCVPRLAEVSLELEEAGRRAVELVVGMAQSAQTMADLRHHRERVPMRFIPHESLGPAPAG